MSIFNYKQRNNIILIGIIILGCFLVIALRGLSSSILGAIVLYTIFRPMYIHLVDKKNWSKALVATLIIVISLVVIVIPFLSLSIMVINKVSSLTTANFPIQKWLASIDAFAGSHLNQPHFIANINITQKIGSYAAELFPSILGSAADIFLTLLVLYFLLYFMFTQNREFEAGLIKYAPFREQHALKFAEELRISTYSNVLGQGIISLSQGIMFAVGLKIAGVEDPIFWGVIGTFISFLPVVGVPTLAIPFGVILLLNEKTWQGVFILIYGVLFIGYIDQFLRFIINKRVANTHPLITVIGVIIGIPLFGILGLVFGPVLLSYFLLLVEIYETNRLAADRLERIQTNSEME
ncbi:putative PurR-regulated permease PerM [Mucilaginibacter gracilis]|uniref:Putative PurR-regulated permease PerM n=1 Tax=Mucilaginibacter gracilis TaxID=423350 RepID=A0A495IZ76_9SPHI|nr:AI-2E family transporter [Mucilaginibacter gracilis]RKR81398.1 putative PurR-regulated permease PerM [Mucilaginibacter gracilis]